MDSRTLLILLITEKPLLLAVSGVHVAYIPAVVQVYYLTDKKPPHIPVLICLYFKFSSWSERY